MLKISEIAFTAYPVSNMVQSRNFYEGVLGLKRTYHAGTPGGMEWTEYDIGAGSLSIGVAPGWKPSSDGCCVALEVEDFDTAIAHLKARDVVFKMEPFASPVCRMAFIFDPDRNVVCIHKRNPAAP